jgi:hypothetical protein
MAFGLDSVAVKQPNNLIRVVPNSEQGPSGRRTEATTELLSASLPIRARRWW